LEASKIFANFKTNLKTAFVMNTRLGRQNLFLVRYLSDLHLASFLCVLSLAQHQQGVNPVKMVFSITAWLLFTNYVVLSLFVCVFENLILSDIKHSILACRRLRELLRTVVLGALLGNETNNRPVAGPIKLHKNSV